MGLLRQGEKSGSPRQSASSLRVLFCAALLAFPAVSTQTSSAQTTAAGAQPQPPPGWYTTSPENEQPSKIFGDAAGLTILWGNSYVYPTPTGAGNLYWYAQVIYRNLSNSVVPISCNEWTDPSVVKEYIRGTEGLAPGTSGYVAADETFCSRNPNFTTSIEPGGAHYSWAIFHNVPPGGEVSLEWGLHEHGVSAWVNPWYSPYKPEVLPTAVCPRELVTLGTCTPRQELADATPTHSVQPTGQPDYAVVQQSADCVADLGTEGIGTKSKPILVFLKNLVNIKNAASNLVQAYVVVEDAESHAYFKVALDVIRFFPYENCIEGIANLLAPGQLPILEKCFEERTPEEKMCVQLMIDRGATLLSIPGSPPTSTLPADQLPDLPTASTGTLPGSQSTSPSAQSFSFSCVTGPGGSCAQAISLNK